jgi:putative ABC transport system permease protein
MVGNFFKIALRFLWRNKAYSILNYLCLTFGLTCSIIATLNVTRVFTYDKFHKNYNRLYEVEANVAYFNGDRFPKENLSASLTDLLKENVPEIESLSRVVSNNCLFINGNESFSESGIYADVNFLDIFSFPLTHGEVAKVLTDNNSIVISERMAIKFFKSTDCIGKTLILKDNSGQEGFTISGVLKNVPTQSYLQFDFIIPFSKFLAGNSLALETGASACQIWALLTTSADVRIANEKMKNLIKGQETTLNQELFMFPLKEKILYYYIDGRRVWREMQNVVVIGCLGFAILLIACFNFINLTIAQNIKRYREAGIKKVAGAKKSLIIVQYLGETFILTLISLFTAICLTRLAVIGLNRAFNGDVQFNFNDLRIILVFAGIAIFTALISGLLPALYLSSSNPVNVLKGKIVSSHSFSFFRQSLIIFQFTIPIVIIIIMIIIRTQDNYIRNFDLGFDKNKLLIIPNLKDPETHSESIRTDLLTIPGIESVSFSNCIPARGAKVSNEVSWEGKNDSEKLHFWCINTDFSYNKAVNIKISEGRYFDKSYPSDSSCYIINDVAAKVMGYENPVGRSLTLKGKKGKIVGVFKEFHALDLAGPFTPTIISITKEGRNNLLIKFSSGSYSSLNEKIKNVFSRYEPDKTFQVILYSDLLKRTELTTASYLAGLAFIISILLACLGLSGLASFTAASRTKEIGIRKINGATIFSIIRLLGLNYTKWLTFASVISLPIAFLIGNIFLSRFNFRSPMPYWAFLAGPFIAYVIALFAVSLQCWRASIKNPVEALRYE